jgi:hypothetical protein
MIAGGGRPARVLSDDRARIRTGGSKLCEEQRDLSLPVCDLGSESAVALLTAAAAET